MEMIVGQFGVFIEFFMRNIKKLSFSCSIYKSRFSLSFSLFFHKESLCLILFVQIRAFFLAKNIPIVFFCLFVYLLGSHVAHLNKYLRWSCWFVLDGKRFNEAFTNITKSSESKRFQFENGPLFFFTLRIFFLIKRFFLDFSLHLTLDDIETNGWDWYRLALN